MRRLVEGYCALQFPAPNIAPRADIVRRDGDVEVCHFADMRSQDDVSWGMSEEFCEMVRPWWYRYCIIMLSSDQLRVLSFSIGESLEAEIDYQSFAILSLGRRAVDYDTLRIGDVRYWCSPDGKPDGCCSRLMRWRCPKEGVCISSSGRLHKV